MVHFGGGLVGEGILLWGFDLMLVRYIIYRTDQIHIYIWLEYICLYSLEFALYSLKNTMREVQIVVCAAHGLVQLVIPVKHSCACRCAMQLTDK